MAVTDAIEQDAEPLPPSQGAAIALYTLYVLLSLFIFDTIYLGYARFIPVLPAFNLDSAPVCLANKAQISSGWPTDKEFARLQKTIPKLPLQPLPLKDAKAFSCSLYPFFLGLPDYQNGPDEQSGREFVQKVMSATLPAQAQEFRPVGATATLIGIILFLADLFFLGYCIWRVEYKRRGQAFPSKGFAGFLGATFEPPGQIFLALGIIGTFFGLGLALVDSFDLVKDLMSSDDGISKDQVPQFSRLVACVSVSVISSLHGAVLSVTCRFLAGILGIAEPSSHEFLAALRRGWRRRSRELENEKQQDKKIDEMHAGVLAILKCCKDLRKQAPNEDLAGLVKWIQETLKIILEQTVTEAPESTANRIGEAIKPRFETMEKAIRDVGAALSNSSFVTTQKAAEQFAGKDALNNVLGGLNDVQDKSTQLDMRTRTVEVDMENLKQQLAKITELLQALNNRPMPSEPRASDTPIAGTPDAAARSAQSSPPRQRKSRKPRERKPEDPEGGDEPPPA